MRVSKFDSLAKRFDPVGKVDISGLLPIPCCSGESTSVVDVNFGFIVSHNGSPEII